MAISNKVTVFSDSFNIPPRTGDIIVVFVASVNQARTQKMLESARAWADGWREEPHETLDEESEG